MNTANPIKLTADNVVQYLKFFTYFVRGDEGPFLLVENEEQQHFDRPLDSASAAKLRAAARPVRCAAAASGAFDCKATVYYSNALFEADFVVRPNGNIEMHDDKPIASNLSSKPYLPID